VSPHLIALGVLRKPIGLDGACALQPYGQSLGRLSLPVPVAAGEHENTCQPLTLSKVEFRPKGPVVYFENIADVNSAETLRNCTLYIDQQLLPELGEGSYYQFELEGMKVQTDQGRDMGTVVSLENFPTVDSLLVRRSDGSTIMIPLTDEALAEVDKKSGFITVKEEFLEELL
jgi:16S rRNA processing protein RimM